MKCFILFPRDIFEKKKKSISNKGGCTMPMTHKNELFQHMAFSPPRKFDNFSCFETRYLIQRTIFFTSNLGTESK